MGKIIVVFPLCDKDYDKCASQHVSHLLFLLLKIWEEVWELNP